MQPNLSVTRLLMPTQVAQNITKQHSEILETARAVALRTEGRSVDQGLNFCWSTHAIQRSNHDGGVVQSIFERLLQSRVIDDMGRSEGRFDLTRGAGLSGDEYGVDRSAPAPRVIRRHILGGVIKPHVPMACIWGTTAKHLHAAPARTLLIARGR